MYSFSLIGNLLPGLTCPMCKNRQDGKENIVGKVWKFIALGPPLEPLLFNIDIDRRI